MEEWQKVLLGAGCGFAGGALMEPLKLAIGRRQRRRHAEKLLMTEMWSLADSAVSWAGQPLRPFDEVVLYYDFTKYEHFNGAGKADLFLIKGDWILHAFYKLATKVYSEPRDSTTERRDDALRLGTMYISIWHDYGRVIVGKRNIQRLEREIATARQNNPLAPSGPT